MKKQENKKTCGKSCKCEKSREVQLPLTIGLPTIPAYVHVAENQGRVEVIFQHVNQRIRLLGDKDGIHVGSLVPVEVEDKPVVEAKVKKTR